MPRREPNPNRLTLIVFLILVPLFAGLSTVSAKADQQTVDSAFNSDKEMSLAPAGLTNRCLNRSSHAKEDLIVRRTQSWTGSYLMSGPCAQSDQFVQDTSLGVPAFFFPPKTPLSDLQDSISASLFDSELKVLTIEEQIAERRQRNERRFEFLRDHDRSPVRPIHPQLWLLSALPSTAQE